MKLTARDVAQLIDISAVQAPHGAAEIREPRGDRAAAPLHRGARAALLGPVPQGPARGIRRHDRRPRGLPRRRAPHRDQGGRGAPPRPGRRPGNGHDAERRASSARARTATARTTSGPWCEAARRRAGQGDPRGALPRPRPDAAGVRGGHPGRRGLREDRDGLGRRAAPPSRWSSSSRRSCGSAIKVKAAGSIRTPRHARDDAGGWAWPGSASTCTPPSRSSDPSPRSPAARSRWRGSHGEDHPRLRPRHRRGEGVAVRRGGRMPRDHLRVVRDAVPRLGVARAAARGLVERRGAGAPASSWARAGRGPSDVACLALSGQSLAVVPVDAAGEPLRESIPIWSDTRAAAQVEAFFRKRRSIGMVPDARAMASPRSAIPCSR